MPEAVPIIGKQIPESGAGKLGLGVNVSQVGADILELGNAVKEDVYTMTSPPPDTSDAELDYDPI